MSTDTPRTSDPEAGAEERTEASELRARVEELIGRELTALATVAGIAGITGVDDNRIPDAIIKARDAVLALLQREDVEPVAWRRRQWNPVGGWGNWLYSGHDPRPSMESIVDPTHWEYEPLYTSPQQGRDAREKPTGWLVHYGGQPADDKYEGPGARARAITRMEFMGGEVYAYWEKKERRIHLDDMPILAAEGEQDE